MVVYAEVLSVNSAVSNLFRYTVQRPRPDAYALSPQPSQPGAFASFYSGHTASAFAALSAASMTYNLRYGPSPWPWVITGVVGLGEGATRILSGRHFYTDVLAGIVAGTSIGIAIPYLHERNKQSTVRITPEVSPDSALLVFEKILSNLMDRSLVLLHRRQRKRELKMKKYMSVPSILMFVLACAWPLRADTGGALPNSPDSVKQIPMAGAAQTDRSGAPKLVVEFQSSHAEIPSSFSENIKTFGQYLADNPGALAEIHGYADHSGHGPANDALAQKRADAVKNYLVTRCAIASSRITAQGYGEISAKPRNSTRKPRNKTTASAIGTIVAN